MISRSSLLTAGGLLLAAGLAPNGWVARAEPQSGAGPMPVLTDTVDYCDQLERQIMARPNRPPDVLRLTAEGHQMCDHGEIRQGVTRLRRALRMLKGRPAVSVLPRP